MLRSHPYLLFFLFYFSLSSISFGQEENQFQASLYKEVPVKKSAEKQKTFFMVTPAMLGLKEGFVEEMAPVDISSQFELPEGSILVAIKNGFVKNGNWEIEPRPNNTEVFVTGTTPAHISIEYSKALETYKTKGIKSLDGVTYSFIGTKNLPAGINLNRSNPTFSLGNFTTNQVSLLLKWESDQPASHVEVFSTCSSEFSLSLGY